ncbi:MAG: hypothetical protein WCG47_26250 [Dermatophilaceae bacterium]
MFAVLFAGYPAPGAWTPAPAGTTNGSRYPADANPLTSTAYRPTGAV